MIKTAIPGKLYRATTDFVFGIYSRQENQIQGEGGMSVLQDSIIMCTEVHEQGLDALYTQSDDIWVFLLPNGCIGARLKTHIQQAIKEV